MARRRGGGMKTVGNRNSFVVEGHQDEFHTMKVALVDRLIHGQPYNRGKWQSEQVSVPASEIRNTLFSYGMPQTLDDLKQHVPADVEWADEHFNERVGGEPLNPAPSYVRWPYHSAKEAERHVNQGFFSHTYPERMWPKKANKSDTQDFRDFGFYSDEGKLIDAYGIRYDYGDTADVVKQLKEDPFTRQAYLPIWFPEDTGATDGQRVPCTLGYHFIRNGQQLDCNYFIRSCDIYRHFTNDVYLAIRLTQWIHDQLLVNQDSQYCNYLGSLNMFISNLHMFQADEWRFQ
jgi:thymidylate synthase